MKAATSATAWRPEEHCLLTVLIGTVSVYKQKLNQQEQQPKISTTFKEFIDEYTCYMVI